MEPFQILNITVWESLAMIPKAILPAFLALCSATAGADCSDELDDLVGYTIIASKTVRGWYDEDGEAEEGSFQGCQHGRKIVFTDNTQITCAEYGYQYAYRPTALLFGKEVSYQGKSFVDFKMMIEEEIYDMRR